MIVLMEASLLLYFCHQQHFSDPVSLLQPHPWEKHIRGHYTHFTTHANSRECIERYGSGIVNTPPSSSGFQRALFLANMLLGSLCATSAGAGYNVISDCLMKFHHLDILCRSP